MVWEEGDGVEEGDDVEEGGSVGRGRWLCGNTILLLAVQLIPLACLVNRKTYQSDASIGIFRMVSKTICPNPSLEQYIQHTCISI